MAAKQWRQRGGGTLCATLALLLVTSGEATAEALPRWERANVDALRQNVAIAVCLPREEEIVCVGVGCRKKAGYNFVEMITGDWLEVPTRLSAGVHLTTTVMSIDRRASRAMNVPVSRGPIRRMFLWQLIGHENESLRVQALTSGYEADFPLAGFRHTHRMLRHICAAERGAFRAPRPRKWATMQISLSAIAESVALIGAANAAPIALKRIQDAGR